MSIRSRTHRLTRKFLSSPVLPALGWTKTVESIVAGGPVGNWIAYATVVTVLWVFAEQLQEQATEVVDDVTD